MIVMSVDLFNIYENNPFVYKFIMQKNSTRALGDLKPLPRLLKPHLVEHTAMCITPIRVVSDISKHCSVKFRIELQRKLELCLPPPLKSVMTLACENCLFHCTTLYSYYLKQSAGHRDFVQ